MTIIEYLLLWFGMITTGFFMGVGSKTAEFVYETHLKQRYNKFSEITKLKKEVIK